MRWDSRVGTTLGKHDVTRLLGKGGMGEVYEAHDTRKGRTVALKMLADQISNDAAFRTRFQREFRSRDSPRAARHSGPRPGEIDVNLCIDMRLVRIG